MTLRSERNGEKFFERQEDEIEEFKVVILDSATGRIPAAMEEFSVKLRSELRLQFSFAAISKM